MQRHRGPVALRILRSYTNIGLNPLLTMARPKALLAVLNTDSDSASEYIDDVDGSSVSGDDIDDDIFQGDFMPEDD